MRITQNKSLRDVRVPAKWLFWDSQLMTWRLVKSQRPVDEVLDFLTPDWCFSLQACVYWEKDDNY